MDTIYDCDVTDATYVGANNGMIILMVTGLEDPLSYAWETAPPAYGQAATNLTRGVYEVEVTDGNGYIDTAQCAVGEPYVSCNGLRTHTTKQWGKRPRNNNAGAYRNSNFNAAFPGGLTVGCSTGYTLELTSANAVKKFLPSGRGCPAILACDYTNPGRSYRNSFAGEVVALTLNIGFDSYDEDFGWADFALADQEIAYGCFSGWTVQELLDEANAKLGGCSSSFSLSQLNYAVTKVNKNFVGCKRTGGYLNCSMYYGSQIGDYVWHDLNGSGDHDQGEPGLEGVTVRLEYAGADGIWGNADDETFTTVTDALGVYDFTQLEPGEYTVEVDEITLPPDMVHTAGQQPRSVTLGADHDFNNADFGFQLQDSRIGDFVFKDLNENGQFDTGEPGIDGVSITLLGAGPDGNFNTSDDITLSTVTNNGNYIFEDLPAGDYTVDVDQGTAPADHDLTTNNDLFPVSLNAGEDRLDADFGFIKPALATSVPGSWSFNCNDATEAIYTAVSADCSGNSAIANFDNSGATENQVIVVYENDYNPGTEITVDGDDGNAYRLSKITLSGPGALEHAYMGTLPAAVSSVTHQSSASTCGDGGGLQSVGVFTIRPSSNGNQTVSVRPDLSGHCNLAEFDIAIPTEITPRNLDVQIPLTELTDDGRHLIITAEAGGVQESITLYGPDAAASCCVASPVLTLANVPGGADNIHITLDSRSASDPQSPQNCGQSWVVVGFVNVNMNCIQSTASVGDYVWEDIDGNGVQDAGESGLGNVDLTLRGGGPDGQLYTADDTYATTTTLADGSYLFDLLPPGPYTVKVVNSSAPSTHVLSSLADSNSITLAEGEARDDADYGYQPFNSSIGDHVWEDVNGDGVQDATESGLGPVTLNLYTPGADQVLGTTDDDLLSTTVNHGSGFYQFSDLAAGDYRVEAIGGTTTDGMVNSTATYIDITLGANDNRDDVDFGFQPRSNTLALDIWEDDNEDCIRDGGEPALAGIDVDVTWHGGDDVLGTADDEVFSGTSDAAGVVTIDDLPAGSFTVDVDENTLPADWVESGACDSGTPIVLNGTSTNAGGGYGFNQPKGDIRGIVWDDLNGDGVRDAGEPSVDGVTVELLDATGTPTGLSTTTSGGGLYTFTDQVPGDYKVKFSNLPTDYKFTNTGGDSKADRTSGETGLEQIVGNALTSDVDAGIALPGKVQMTVSASVPILFSPITPVTYTYTMTNTGGVPLDNPTVSDVSCPPAYASGDLNANNKLENNETWTFTCTRTWTWTLGQQIIITPNTNCTDVIGEASLANAINVIPTAGPNMDIQTDVSAVCPGDTISIKLISRMVVGGDLEADQDIQFYDFTYSANLLENGTLQTAGPANPYWADPSGDYSNTRPGAMPSAIDYDDFVDVDNGSYSPDWIHEFEYVVPVDQTEDLVVVACDHTKAYYYFNNQWASFDDVRIGTDTLTIPVNCPQAIVVEETWLDNILNPEVETPVSKQDENIADQPQLFDQNSGSESSLISVAPAVTFEAFPNPFVNEIVVSWPEIFEGGQLELLNGLGYRVRTMKLTGYQERIPMQDYPRGVYYLKIEKEDKVEIKQMIKL